MHHHDASIQLREHGGTTDPFPLLAAWSIGLSGWLDDAAQAVVEDRHSWWHRISATSGQTVEHPAPIEPPLGQSPSAGVAPSEARSGGIAGATPSAPVREVAHGGSGGLTAREVEVLRLLVAGMSNQEIAATLFVSRHTAGNHVGSILGKLDVPNRAAAAAWAVRHGYA